MKKLRQDGKLTLQAAADAMELDLKHVQKIEAGSVNATLVTIYRIAKGLGVTMHELFYEPMPSEPRTKKDAPYGHGNPKFTKTRIKPKPF